MFNLRLVSKAQINLLNYFVVKMIGILCICLDWLSNFNNSSDMILIVFLSFVNSGDTGKTVIMAKVPDTITSWIASAFALSDASGLGVSKPTSLKVFQPFFVSLTLPYSVIRGEEVSIITTVFNYEKKEFEQVHYNKVQWKCNVYHATWVCLLFLRFLLLWV